MVESESEMREETTFIVNRNKKYRYRRRGGISPGKRGITMGVNSSADSDDAEGAEQEQNNRFEEVLFFCVPVIKTI